jgi:hypothetical protein
MLPRVTHSSPDVYDSWPVVRTRFNESHRADVEGVSVTELNTPDFPGRLSACLSCGGAQ